MPTRPITGPLTRSPSGGVTGVGGLSLAAWRRILALAQADGWSVLYDPGNPASITGAVDQISASHGSYPALVSGVTDPAISTIGALGAVKYGDTAASPLKTAAFGASFTPPYSIMAAVDLAAPSTDQFAIDGIASPSRTAIYVSTGAWSIFDGAGSASAVESAQAGGHVVHAEIGPNSSSLHVDGLRVTGRTAAGASLSGLCIGDRYLSDGRYWRGKVGPTLVYQGTPSPEKRMRMRKLLATCGGIPLNIAAITAAGTCTLSDGGGEIISDAPDVKRGIASIAKLLTALVVMERVADLNTTATFTADDVSTGSLAGLTVGDVVTYLDLLYCLLLPSGNDAAQCLARSVGEGIAGGGTAVERFVAEMNTKASAIGMGDYTFTTPHGLGTTEATPRGVCKLAIAAAQDATIAGVAGTASRLVTVTGVNARTFTVTHTVNGANFPGYIAGKTGTGNSLFNLAIVWEYNGERFATSVLASPTDRGRTIDAQGHVDFVAWSRTPT